MIHVGYFAAPDIVDSDGDGYLDLVVGCYSGALSYLVRQANGTPSGAPTMGKILTMTSAGSTMPRRPSRTLTATGTSTSGSAMGTAPSPT